ncbi:MAG: acyltransferase family protein [Candidatus Hinthialibacter antarcticus]|nr:acyltransferase family protein [Candidatus Hinthialibacter antarcticus]
MNNATTQTTAIDRRHDLDALRAIAMLSGIALHASLSFIPGLWPVQDNQQAHILGLIPAFLHGFRMPLFFLISGFFTAMLWRKRGLKSLLRHRFRRIFIPFALCLITIIPASYLIIGWAMTTGTAQSVDEEAAVSTQASADLWSAARVGDLEKIRAFVEDGAGINQQDQIYGITPLSTATMTGQLEAVELLLELGADVNMPVRDGSTPLHTAAFFGEAEVAKVLLQNGADADIKNSYGQTSHQSLTADMGTTQFIAGLVNVKFDPQKINEGRSQISEILGVSTGQERSNPVLSILYGLLFSTPVLQHLWFLWFLIWLVVGFAVYALIADALNWNVQSSKLILSPLRYMWLVPLTMVPQLFMIEPTFGSDTSAGLLPMPHVLLYYAVFFGFGALYFDAKDEAGALGKRYWLTLPVAILVIFPIGMIFTHAPNEAIPLIPSARQFINNLLQVAYVWLMTFGCMGLFRRLLSRESKWMRYISDSSYWLYIAHLPLIFFVQAYIRDWQMPALAKFVLVTVLVTGFLLVIYETMVRYTWVGALLNGRKKRGGAAIAQPAE